MTSKCHINWFLISPCKYGTAWNAVHVYRASRLLTSLTGSESLRNSNEQSNGWQIGGWWMKDQSFAQPNRPHCNLIWRGREGSIYRAKNKTRHIMNPYNIYHAKSKIETKICSHKCKLSNEIKCAIQRYNASL